MVYLITVSNQTIRVIKDFFDNFFMGLNRSHYGTF